MYNVIFQREMMLAALIVNISTIFVIHDLFRLVFTHYLFVILPFVILPFVILQRLHNLFNIFLNAFLLLKLKLCKLIVDRKVVCM